MIKEPICDINKFLKILYDGISLSYLSWVVEVDTHNIYWILVCGANVINIRVSEVISYVDLTWNDPNIKFISEAKNMK
jgi:hypothetical protein